MNSLSPYSLDPRHARAHTHDRLRCHSRIALTHKPIKLLRRQRRNPVTITQLSKAKKTHLLTHNMVHTIGTNIMTTSAVDILSAQTRARGRGQRGRGRVGVSARDGGTD